MLEMLKALAVFGGDDKWYFGGEKVGPDGLGACWLGLSKASKLRFKRVVVE